MGSYSRSLEARIPAAVPFCLKFDLATVLISLYVHFITDRGPRAQASVAESSVALPPVSVERTCRQYRTTRRP
jgi:hypothetical protein